MTKQNENKKEKYATKKGIVKNTREKNPNVKEKKMNIEKRVRKDEETKKQTEPKTGKETAGEQKEHHKKQKQ